MFEHASYAQALNAAVACTTFVLLFTCSVCCGSDKYNTAAGGNAMPVKAIDEVLKEHTKALMSIPGVVGTGQGLHKGKPCVKVFVTRKTAVLDEKIPHALEGYPVIIEEIGEVKARPEK